MRQQPSWCVDTCRRILTNPYRVRAMISFMISLVPP